MSEILKNIESLFPEKHWLSAEEYYETHNSSIEANLKGRTNYSFSFDDQKIEITLKSKSTYTCSCGTYKDSKECMHILVGLLHIRNKQNQKEEKKKTRKVTRQTSDQNFHIRSILPQVTKDELDQFIKGYAAKEKSFNLALKVHFARKIDLHDNNIKYSNIFKAIVKPKTHKHNKLSITGRKDFHRTLENLTDTLEDCISLELFREAMYILANSLDAIFYVRKNYIQKSERLDRQEKIFLDSLDKLLQLDLPPELHSELVKRMLDLTTLSYFTPAKDNLLIILLKNELLDKEQGNDIAIALSSRIDVQDEYYLEFVNSVLILASLDPAILEHIPDQVKMSTINESIIELDYQDLPDLSQLLAKYRIDNELSNKRLDVFYINGLVEVGNKDFLKAIQNFHVSYNDIKATTRIISRIPEDKLQPNLESLNSRFENSDDITLYEVFRASNQIEKLYDALLERGDLEHLWKYSDDIDSVGEEKILALYRKMLINHLETTAGQKANDAINYTVKQLSDNGYKKIGVLLKKEIKEQFSHRKSLVAAL